MVVLLVRVHFGSEESPRASVLRAVSEAAVCFFDVCESLDNAQQFADVRVMLLPSEGPEQQVFGLAPVMQTLSTFSVQPTLVLRVQMRHHHGKPGNEAAMPPAQQQEQNPDHVTFSTYFDDSPQSNNKRHATGLPVYNQIKSPAMSSYPVIPPHLLQHGAGLHFSSSSSSTSSSASSSSSSSPPKAPLPEDEGGGDPQTVTSGDSAVFASLDAALFRGPTDNVQLNKVVYLIQSMQERGVQEQDVPRVFAESFGEKYELKRLRASIEKKVAAHVQISTHDGIAWYFSASISSERIQERFQLLPVRKKSKKAKVNAPLTTAPDADFTTVADASLAELAKINPSSSEHV